MWFNPRKQLSTTHHGPAPMPNTLAGWGEGNQKGKAVRRTFRQKETRLERKWETKGKGKEKKGIRKRRKGQEKKKTKRGGGSPPLVTTS